MSELPGDARICATCAFWQQDHSWSPATGSGHWPGDCPRRMKRTTATETCHLWSEPEVTPSP